MESSKQAWLKKQRSLRDKASGNKSKEVQALNKQLQAALQVLDVERYHVAACEEAAMPAEKGPGRHAPQHAPASIELKIFSSRGGVYATDMVSQSKRPCV